MQNSKLIQVLSKFSLKEMKELEKFMGSSLFNNSKKTYSSNCLLIEYISKNHSKLTGKALDKEVIFSMLFPNLEYNKNARKLRDISSNVLKIVENFIVISQVKKNTLKYQIELLQYYSMFELDKHHADAYKTFNEHLEKTINKGDAEYYRNKYTAEFVSKEEYGVSKPSFVRGKPDQTIKIVNTAIQDFDLYYLIKQMELYCYLMTRSRVIKQTPSISPLLAILLQNIEQTPYYSNVAVKVYHQTILMLQNPNEESYYFNLKKALFNNYDFSNKVAIRSIFGYLKNYCTLKASEGKAEYYEEYLELYQYQLENGIIDNINAALFKNLVVVYLLIDQPKEAEYFINNFLEKVTPKAIQNEVYQYNFAKLKFYQEEYNNVIQLLLGENTEEKQVRIPKFKDIYYQIAARILLLQTYYELNQEDEISQMWENSKQFIWQKQKVISQIGFERFNNFIVIFRKLHHLPLDKRSKFEKVKDIKVSIKNQKELTGRTWLLQKLEAL